MNRRERRRAGASRDEDGGRKKTRRSFIGKALTRMTRYSEILSVFIKYGFSDSVRKVDHGHYRRLRGTGRDSRRARKTWSRPERMRRAMEDLGPTFVKIGQLLSHRPDLLPEEWVVEFGKLRGEVPPVDIGPMRAIVEEDLGAPPEEIFDSFDPVPVASASIAQVYRARVRIDGTATGPGDSGENGAGREGLPGDSPGEDAGTGEDADPGAGGRKTSPEMIDVAVKIQRPRIRKTIEADLAILRDLAWVAERRIPSIAVFRPTEGVREIEKALLCELDFRNEADNLEIFRKNFSSHSDVTAPEPLRGYSGRRILVMEWIDGIPVGDSEALGRSGVDRKALARRGADAVLRQIFEHRFFHADPHGGNIFIRPDGRIAFLDFGQAGTVLPSQRLFLADLLSALIRTDAPRAVRAILGWSGYRDPDSIRKLTSDMEQLIERFLSRPFGRLDLGEMVSSIFGLVRRYSIEIPSNFYLLAKSLATIEDIAGALDPDFDFIRASQPFAKRMVRKELSPGRIAEQMAGASGDAVRFLRDFPGETRDLMRLLKDGKFRLEFELKDMEKLDSTLKRVVTRLSAAVLLAAMIMGSSLLVLSGIPPLIYRVPVIGVLGFLFSGVVGVMLLFDLWRHR